jgi:serine/threonine-protein kinase
MPLDARSDLYALGILAFEMLTGNVPYNDENPMTVIQMHLHGTVPPMPDSVPYSVQQVVRRALEKDPSRRYQSAGEMMQQCQQVFAELNAGGVAVGAGGVPRTVIAPGPPALGAPPGGPPPGQGPGGYVASAPQAKTMIAQNPFSGGSPGGPQPPQGGPGAVAGGPGAPPGGFVQASPMQKTIVAGMAPPIVGGQMMPHGAPGGFPPPGAPGGMPGMPGAPGMPSMPGMAPGGMPPAGGPNKTVMLQPSEGVVSVARTGQPLQATTGPIVEGASTLYWIVCLVAGIAVGVLAYVLVRQL